MTVRVRAIRQDFDWSSLRFPGERMVLAEIRQDEKLWGRMADFSNIPAGLAAGSANAGPASGIRLGSTLGSGVARLLEVLRQTLQISCRLELEVFSSSRPDLWVETSADQRVRTIRASSRIVESASARQFLFDVGRKVGQSLLDPLSLLADPSCGLPEGARPTLLARGLWRFQQMMSDRFGLLCCQDVETALWRLLEHASGLNERSLDWQLADWLEGRPAEEEAMLSPHEDDFLRLRCAALMKFAQSQRYDSAFSASFIELAGTTSPTVPQQETTFDRRAIPPALPVAEPVPPPRLDTPSPAPAPPAVTYRMVGGDPSVVEAVFTDLAQQAATVPSPAPAEPDRFFESEVRRNVGSYAAFWLLSQTDEVTSRQRSLLADLYGEEVFDEVRPKFEQYGERLFPEYCYARRADLARLDSATRFDMLRELVRLAMTDHSDPALYQPVFLELTALFHLTSEDLEQALADFVDPQFARYGFGPGEAVEVRLDGEWVVGTVESVDTNSGEVRVRFSTTGKSLRLHPLADVIRPRTVRQAS